MMFWEQQRLMYGHDLTEQEIRKRYPYTNVTVHRRVIKNRRYTITFDVLMAYKLRKKGVQCLIWGGQFEDVRVFVFAKRRIKTAALPF